MQVKKEYVNVIRERDQEGTEITGRVTGMHTLERTRQRYRGVE